MKRIITLIILFTLISSGCMGKKQSQQTQNTIYSEKDPLKEHFLKEGIQELKNKDFKDALMSLKRAITENPTDPKPYLMLGEIYTRAGLYKNAVKYFEAASRLKPYDGKIMFELAKDYGLSGDNKKSLQCLKKSIELFKSQKDIIDYKKATSLLSTIIHTNKSKSNTKR